MRYGIPDRVWNDRVLQVQFPEACLESAVEKGNLRWMPVFRGMTFLLSLPGKDEVCPETGFPVFDAQLAADVVAVEVDRALR